MGDVGESSSSSSGGDGVAGGVVVWEEGGRDVEGDEVATHWVEKSVVVCRIGARRRVGGGIASIGGEAGQGVEVPEVGHVVE